ncbi:uncharacterized protein LOC110676047 [Aedes aegypti]|uniref:Uncharacterized protein n=1 Tax=Aedes aegypti TaxID=7159 RepID=A0A6I8U5M9_AEDAE|nr:uncharacterized protein LOC110676047 [Aedes aegypti]
MKTSSVWITFAVAITAIEGHYYTELELDPHLHTDFHLAEGDSYYPLDVESYQNHLPFELYQPSSTFWDHFLQKPKFMNYQAQPNSLINYTPVEPNSWIKPNVFVNGQGYITDRYVAPTMLKRLLAMSPR